MNPQLNIFSTRVYQNDLFGSEYITVLPFNNLDNGPIDFQVRESRDYYDLSETILSLKVKLLNADGSPIESSSDGSDNVALVTNAMHSIFSDAQVKINGKSIEGVADGMYPYKSYMTSLFKFSKETQTEQLFSEGFLRDDYTDMDTVNNKAFIARKAWTIDGASKTFFGKLSCSIFQTNKLLIPGVDFLLRLERAKSTFSIFCANKLLKPKIVIQEARLHMLAMKTNPNIMEYHTDLLSRGIPAIYEFNKVEIETISIRELTTSHFKEDLFHGRVPNFLIMGMVSSRAFNGNYSLNPFNFKHYNIKSLLLTRDAENIPFERFEPDFTTGNCLREFMSLYQSNDLLGKNVVLPINYEEFKSGFTCFQWNLSDNRRGMNAGPNQRGNVKLEMAFAEPTSEALVVVLYGMFESTVQIFGNDVVIVDDA